MRRFLHSALIQLTAGSSTREGWARRRETGGKGGRRGGSQPRFTSIAELRDCLVEGTRGLYVSQLSVRRMHEPVVALPVPAGRLEAGDGGKGEKGGREEQEETRSDRRRSAVLAGEVLLCPFYRCFLPP